MSSSRFSLLFSFSFSLLRNSLLLNGVFFMFIFFFKALAQKNTRSTYYSLQRTD